MTETTYSIAKARNQFDAIVRDAEETNLPIKVTCNFTGFANYDELTIEN